MNDKIEKRYLTADDISRHFSIPLNTIYRLSKLGKISGIKIGKQWRYLKDEIEQYITKTSQKYEPLHERRLFPRINCNFECKYRVNISSIKEFKSDAGSIRNISGGGAFIYDKPQNLDHISEMDPIELDFEFACERGVKNIKVLARVVRKGQCGNVLFGLGIKFRDIDKDSLDEIIKYVG